MNAQELPMILFTVFAQMAVGSFWVLGCIHLGGYLKKISPETIDRVTNAAMYAVGPLLVLGFFAAFFHLHDPMHALNTLRHIGSSWLSREIASGILFGFFGFLFAITQWFNLMTRKAREIFALLTALAGLLLVISMCGVYYSVTTIPAWHNPATWIFFFASAILTGSLAIGIALLVTWNLQARRDSTPADETTKQTFFNRLISPDRLTSEVTTLTTRSLQGISLSATIAGLAILVTYPIYITSLANGPQAAQDVANRLVGPALIIRLILLAAVILLTGVFAYMKARTANQPNTSLAWIITTAFILALASELLGRALHYEGLWHVGLNTAQTLLGQ